MRYSQSLPQWKVAFDIFIFWKLSWGLENDNTLFKKMIIFAIFPKPEKR